MANIYHDEQTLELAKSLERFAPAILDTQWNATNPACGPSLDTITVDALRIDSRHMPLLNQICLAGNVTVAYVNHY